MYRFDYDAEYSRRLGLGAPRYGSGLRRVDPAIGAYSDQYLRRRFSPPWPDLCDRVRSQIRGEVAVERRERSRVGGPGPEADVAIGANQDHAARRDAGADGIDTGVMRYLRKLGPASVQPR